MRLWPHLPTSGSMQAKASQTTPPPHCSFSLQRSSFFRQHTLLRRSQRDGSPITWIRTCWPLWLRGPFFFRCTVWPVSATLTHQIRCLFSTSMFILVVLFAHPVTHRCPFPGLPLRSTFCSAPLRTGLVTATATEHRSKSASRSWAGTTGLSTQRFWPSTTVTGTAQPGIEPLPCWGSLSAALPSQGVWGHWGSPPRLMAATRSSMRRYPTLYLKSAHASEHHILNTQTTKDSF